jgi:predicted nucleic acid-binding protein
MTENTFVDTNIFVYFRDSADERKQLIASECLSKLWENKTWYISTQVLNEYFVAVTKKIRMPLSASDAWSDIEELEKWNPVNLDFELLKTAYQAISIYSLSWWDALIIAGAKVCGCKTILSEDFSTGKDDYPFLLN